MKCEKCYKERVLKKGLCCDCNSEKKNIKLLKEIFYFLLNKIGRKKKCFLKKRKTNKNILKEYRQLEGLDLVREKVRIRDNHRCQICNKKWFEGDRRFDVHHLDEEMESKKIYQYDKNNIDKMITLCHKCHMSLPHVRKKISIARNLQSTYDS